MPKPSRGGARQGLSTRAIHSPGSGGGPRRPEPPSSGQAPPSLFGSPTGDGSDIIHAGNRYLPTQTAVAEKIAALEGLPACLVLGSGMAATSMTLLALLRPGDHLVASRHLHGATRRLLLEDLPRSGITATLVDPQSGREWRQAVQGRTRVLLLEIPTNPTLRIFDPRPIARLAAEEGISLVVDATFASPINLRPAELGADVVIHSGCKYLGGGSDIIAGVVSGSADLVKEVQEMARLHGPSVDPGAAWLLERGLQTLAVRMERHNQNAQILAEWLEGQPEVAAVLYPGLESHPDHLLAREIMDGFGGMVGMQLVGGNPAADVFCQALKLAMVAPSLGGVETLVSQPRLTSHQGMSAEEMSQEGIHEGFVRILVGLEDVEDLRHDLQGALEAVTRGGR